jgi:hypothetical protein
MFNKNKLAKLFGEPTKHANDLIQDQLERMEVQFDQHLKDENLGDALAIYQEYVDWIEADEGSTYGMMLLERINTL